MAFDFDGTLAPIIRDRGHAFMRAETLDLFAQVCQSFKCAVISGRSRHDVMSRLGAAMPFAVIGNHGAENSDTPRAQDVELMRNVVALLADSDLSDLDVENKTVSLSIHFWNRPSPQDISPSEPSLSEPPLSEPVIHERLEELEVSLKRVLQKLNDRIRYVPGHRVINVVPADAPNKGDALKTLMESLDASPVLYVGDDITDEDVFKLDSSLVASVKVGCDDTTSAKFCIENQLQIDRLLQKLIALHSSCSSAPAQHQAAPSTVKA